MVFILFVIELLFVTVCPCNILINKDPQDYPAIKDSILKLEHSKCIETIINKGKYPQIEKYLSILIESKIDFKNELKAIIKNKLSTIHNIKQKFIVSQPIVVINPAFQWNENKQYVFIKIFFKKNHRDNPICDELENESFEILTDSNMVHFEGVCYDKKMTLVKFELDLGLNGNLNKLRSLYNNLSKDEKGTYTVTLFKSNYGLWNKLLKHEDNKIKNMIKWENFEFAEKSYGFFLSINICILILYLLF